MTLPNTANIPWNPEKISLEGRGGVYNQKQVEYFKGLIKALHSMYTDIANEVNLVVLDAENILKSTTVVCHNDTVVCHNNEVVTV
jgi:hypothetical protein